MERQGLLGPLAEKMVSQGLRAPHALIHDEAYVICLIALVFTALRFKIQSGTRGKPVLAADVCGGWKGEGLAASQQARHPGTCGGGRCQTDNISGCV